MKAVLACEARPVLTCACISAATFLTLLVIIISRVATPYDHPYYVDHLIVAFLIFFFGAGTHHAVVHRFKLTDGNWLCGFQCALPFYLSREIRDREKLGHWDLPGLWWPTAGLILLFILLEASSAAWRRSSSRRRAVGLDGEASRVADGL